ncbi:MAG: hypothetical protein GYB35_15480 [Algicola sp.]|nr:hypothetical protein [Algicola sp.]
MKLEAYSNLEIIWEHQRRVINIYRAENLKSIEGLNREYTINNTQVLLRYYQLIGKLVELYSIENVSQKLKFDSHRTFEELRTVSNEIMYYTALTILHSEHLTSPLDNPIRLDNNKTIYANHMDLSDVRFYMFANSAVEKLYNYWDRIGDLLALFFPENISQKEVYFSRINSFIPKEYHTQENIAWLLAFRKREFKKLNRIRISIVHYEGLSVDYIHNHIKNPDDIKLLTKLVNSRPEFISWLKEHIEMSLKGLVETLNFIEFCNEKILTETELRKIKRDAIKGKTRKDSKVSSTLKKMLLRVLDCWKV